MTRKLCVLLAFLAVLAAVGCRQAGESFEQAKEAAKAAYTEAESFDEKLSIANDFLARFPGNEDTGDILGMVVGAALEAERPEAAYELIDTALAKTEDPDVRHEVKMQLAALHGRTGKKEELRALAAELGAERELRYGDLYPLMESAVEAEAWELVIEQADTSMAFATAEAYKEDSPDVSDADAARYGDRRIAYSMANKGWAQFKLGQAEEALATFAAARGSTVLNLLGVDDTPLHRYWGRTLLAHGEPVEAMELLASEALFGSEADARDAYRQAYSACNEDGEDGFDDHFWELRRERGVAVPDFELPNYDDETVRFADFEGDVVLLAFWFPT